MKTELYLGLDVHQDSIATGVAAEGRNGEVRDTGAISNDLHALEKWIARLGKAHGPELVIHAFTKRVRAALALRADSSNSGSIASLWRLR